MRCNDKGFTLIEIIITTSIISLLALMAVPAVGKIVDTCNLKAEARQMAGVLRLAQQEAVTSGYARTIIFYPDGRYKVYDQVDQKFTGYCLKNGVKFLGDTTFNSTFLNYPACIFSPLGNPVGGGTITLRAASGERIYIITNPVQGRIRISSQPPASWN